MEAKFRMIRLFVVLLAVVSCGCSGGERLGTVTGTVKVNGRIVTQGTIMFIPADGKAAVGAIAKDGTYSLTTYASGDGALVGEHRVTILATLVGAGSMAPASIDDEIAIASGKAGNKLLVPGKVEWIVPERYSQLTQTDLTATVKPGKQTIDFDLPKE
jgi:hypothetical protein